MSLVKSLITSSGRRMIRLHDCRSASATTEKLQFIFKMVDKRLQNQS
jgi:hypothetical protein